MNGTRAGLWVVTSLIVSATAAGCVPQRKADLDEYYASRERRNMGMVVILPGIEGESSANRNIRRGLDEGGLRHALVIYRWGFPVPGLGMLVNQTDTSAARKAAGELAQAIVRYQGKHPGKPVFFIGHSAGGAIAVFTLEALADMPGAAPVDGAILLSSSISADYPLGKAMRMTRQGICNGYNPDDKALLGAGTAMFGNVDGGHGDSAGRTGFHQTDPKLFQFRIRASDVGGDPHFIVTDADLVARHAPRWVLAKVWPPPRQTASPSDVGTTPVSR